MLRAAVVCLLWALVLAGHIDPGGAEAQELRYAPLPHMELVAESVLRHYRVVWRGTEIQGVVSPSNPITVTLAQADGGAKGTAVTDSESTGKLSVTFGSIFPEDR